MAVGLLRLGAKTFNITQKHKVRETPKILDQIHMVKPNKKKSGIQMFPVFGGKAAIASAALRVIRKLQQFTIKILKFLRYFSRGLHL